MAADDKKKSTVEDSKKKALELALQQIEKNYGKGAVMRLGQNSAMNVECIPTGSLMLDAALGIGGLPRGRIIEIYGPEASGKTTLALHAVAEAQKMGGEAAFIDVEHALDPVYAKALGVDVDSLLVSQAGYRRAGAGNRRSADSFRRGGYRRYRLGRRAGSPRGDRRGYGRQSCRSAGAFDVSGHAETGGRGLQIAVHGGVYQPASSEGRRGLWQPGSYRRRQCAEILCVRSGWMSAAPKP